MPHVEPEAPSISQNEQRELKRVFDFMCDFAPKHRLRKELQPRADRKAKIMSFKKNPEAVKIVDEAGHELSEDILDAELLILDKEMNELQHQIDQIDAKPDTEKKVHPRDLQQALAFLGKHTDKVSNKLS